MLRSTQLLNGAAVSCAVSAFGMMVYALTVADGASLPALISAAALLAASSGWLLNNATTMRLKLRDKAYEFHKLATAEDKITPHLKLLNDQWNNAEFRKRFDATDERISLFLEGELKDEFFIAIQKISNFFEEMAILIRRDAVDEMLLYDYFDGMFLRFMEKYEPVLPLIRNTPPLPGHRLGAAGRPEIGVTIEWLAKRWRKRHSKMYYSTPGRLKRAGKWISQRLDWSTPNIPLPMPAELIASDERK